MAAIKDITGQRFGRLIASHRVMRSGRLVWRCHCDCGGSKDIRSSSLLSGDTKSCGCLIRDFNSANKTKHGMDGTAEYRTWRGMIARCIKPRSHRWKTYGARGIAVCERWRQFENFYADMGRRPSPSHSLDRIDNDGNYEPGNCRWATAQEQQGNRSISIRIEHNGETHHLSEWARRFKLRVDTLARRYGRGDRPPRLFRSVRGRMQR